MILEIRLQKVFGFFPPMYLRKESVPLDTLENEEDVVKMWINQH